MKDMFDAIVPPLPDPAYYEQRDISEEVRRKLTAAEEPFGCILRGPAAWDPARQPSFPIYSACKTNTEDNPDFVPYRYGTVILSSVETGDVLLRLMREDEGKMPLARPRPPRRERPGLPRAKTYSVNDMWRTLVPEDFRGGSGTYQAFLHAGDFQSEPFRFQVARGEGKSAGHPYEAVLKAKSTAGPATAGIPSASFEPLPAPEAPANHGASLTVGQRVRKDGKEFLPVQGSFRFQGTWAKEWERLPLHVLVAVRGERELDLNTLWIPRADCRIEGSEYAGQFRFDLLDLFRAADGAAKPPPEAWISLVHRGWRGPIVKRRITALP